MLHCLILNKCNHATKKLVNIKIGLYNISASSACAIFT